MFKAYLFLASGSNAQEKRFDLDYHWRSASIIYAIFCGTLASILFGYISHKSWSAGDTSLVLLLITVISGAQLAMPLLREANFKNIVSACILTLIAACIYGWSIRLLTWGLVTSVPMRSIPLNLWHILGMVILSLAWLASLYMRTTNYPSREYSNWLLKKYVQMLNASQAHPSTITAHRNHYQY
jgi:NAD(P)H-quinone oxidoreductase subunit 5